MKDFPVFTTEYGVASLTLRDIPYLQNAYIVIQDSLEPEKLLAECVSFCRACGAERIYAKEHKILEGCPLHTVLYEMRCDASSLADTEAALWPVQEQTLEQWRMLYNEKVRYVPNGAWMTIRDAQKMLEKGEGYFIHRDRTLLGIGKLGGNCIDWVASVLPGAGRDVVTALARGTMSDTVSLIVASSNEKALRLYEELGFIKTREISRWYRV